MDSFSVSLASGMCRGEQLKRKHLIFFPLSLAVFQAGFFAVGWLFGNKFQSLISSVDHWIAFGILTFIGVRMIMEALKKDEAKAKYNPFKFWNTILLSVGTSIDAMAVGIAYACASQTDNSIVVGSVSISTEWATTAVLWMTTVVFSLVGLLLGKFLKRRINFPFEVLGGAILIFIGGYILLEHLGII
ncbi:MAG: manganese efflux pump MntP family protein [Bacteroidales bacterium]|nr:manganese efflux pump MntP family protein [Bacteroidales bacterium]